MKKYRILIAIGILLGLVFLNDLIRSLAIKTGSNDIIMMTIALIALLVLILTAYITFSYIKWLKRAAERMGEKLNGRKKN